MKTKTILLLAILVVLTLPGPARVKTIPEISANLSDIDMMDFTGEGLMEILAAHDTKLVMIKATGEVFRWDTEDKMVDSLYNLNRHIRPGVFQQGDYLVVREQETAVHVIFSLSQMKEVAVIDNPEIRRVLGVDADRLVYLSEGNRLMVTDVRSGSVSGPKGAADGAAVTLQDGETVFNCGWQGNQALILASHHVYRYSTSGGAFDSLPLKIEAVSGFLAVGDDIYYGSAQRELIKYSLRARKVRWRFKLADHLSHAPVKLGPYIVIVPADNNIYFFNRNGSVYWWQKLDSTLFKPPYPMTRNAVVFLWNQTVKFFDYRKKQVTTYPLDRRPATNPVLVGDYIYVVTTEADEDRRDDELPALRRLSRLGNHYGVEVKTSPEYIKPAGKSVKFTLAPINLIEPRFKVTIVNTGSTTGVSGGEVLFTKEIGSRDKPNFVWVPPDAAEYTLKIEIDALNKKGLMVVETFATIDVDLMLWKYYYDVQSAGSGFTGR